jgi:hypothetical protein
MTHIHSHFSDEQVKLLIRPCGEGQMSRAQVEELWCPAACLGFLIFNEKFLIPGVCLRPSR